MRITNSTLFRSATLALSLAFAITALVGCESSPSGGGGDSRSDDSAGPTKPWTDSSDPAPAPAGGALKTRDLNDVAGVGGTPSRPYGDVLFSLYDVGRGRKSGVSRTIIHVFPESSRKYRRLALNGRDWIAKRIPDDDMRALIEAADEAGFSPKMRRMTQAEVDSEFARGNSVITLEEPGRLRGTVRPRLSAGASEEDIKLFQDMKQTFMVIARSYMTPTVSGGAGPGRQFKTPERR